MKNSIKFSGSILVVLFWMTSVNAQQTPILSNVYENPWVYNPAGFNNYKQTRASLIHRNQWTGFEGNPRTTAFGIHGTINEKHALGFQVMNDETNLIKNLNAKLNYVYSVKLKEKHRLSFGIAGGVAEYGVDFDRIKAKDVDDQGLFLHAEKKTSLNVDAGIQYQFGKFKAGLASYNLLAQPVQMVEQTSNGELKYQVIRHLGLNLNYDFVFSENLHLQPLVVVRSVQGSDVVADINLRFMFEDFVWAGAGYRNLNSLNIFAGAYVFNKLGVGYSYEYPLFDDQKAFGQTHEINVLWKFLKPNSSAYKSDTKRRRQEKRNYEKLKTQNAEQYEQLDQLNLRIAQLVEEIEELQKKQELNEQEKAKQEKKFRELLENEIQRKNIQSELGSEGNLAPANATAENSEPNETQDTQNDKKKNKEYTAEEIEEYLNELAQRKPKAGINNYVVVSSFKRKTKAENYQKRIKKDLGMNTLVVHDEERDNYYVCSSKVNDFNEAVIELKKDYESLDIVGLPWVFETKK